TNTHTHTHTHTPTRHKTHQTKPHTTASQRHPSTHPPRHKPKPQRNRRAQTNTHTHTHTHTPTRHKTHQTKPHTTASQRHPSTHRQASLRTHYNDRPLHQHISTREAPASTPCRFSALRHGPLPHIPEASNRQAGSHPPPKTKMSSSWLTRTLLVRPASGPDRGDTQHRAQSTQHTAGRLVCGADQALGELFSRSPSCPNSCGILRLAVGVVAPHSPTKKVGRL
ncbi:hypothetical protein PHYSODRAFT_505526, partial [Phytophthora sojae]